MDRTDGEMRGSWRVKVKGEGKELAAAKRALLARN
jgi:hypothetical protein